MERMIDFDSACFKDLSCARINGLQRLFLIFCFLILAHEKVLRTLASLSLSLSKATY